MFNDGLAYVGGIPFVQRSNRSIKTGVARTSCVGGKSFDQRRVLTLEVYPLFNASPGSHVGGKSFVQRWSV